MEEQAVFGYAFEGRATTPAPRWAGSRRPWSWRSRGRTSGTEFRDYLADAGPLTGGAEAAVA